MDAPVAGRIRLPTGRAFLAAGLVVGYLGLIGEAVYCQFMPAEHHDHQQDSPRHVNHATHCLLANHSSAAVPEAVVVAIPVLYPVGLQGERPHHRTIAPDFTLIPARAPPSVQPVRVSGAARPT
jgi:hypothetical protein